MGTWTVMGEGIGVGVWMSMGRGEGLADVEVKGVIGRVWSRGGGLYD